LSYRARFDCRAARRVDRYVHLRRSGWRDADACALAVHLRPEFRALEALSALRPGMAIGRRIPNAVLINYSTGYASIGVIPNAFQLAQLMLINHWNENRELFLANQTINKVPWASRHCSPRKKCSRSIGSDIREELNRDEEISSTLSDSNVGLRGTRLQRGISDRHELHEFPCRAVECESPTPGNGGNAASQQVFCGIAAPVQPLALMAASPLLPALSR